MEERTDIEPLDDLEEDVLDLNELLTQKEALRIQEYIEHLDSRKAWSTWLLYVLVFLVLTNMFLVIAVGLHWLQLDLNFLKVVYISVVLEVLGLVLFVVKFLFKEPPQLK